LKALFFFDGICGEKTFLQTWLLSFSAQFCTTLDELPVSRYDIDKEDIQMLIVVDLNRCQAYAQCCFLAPGVFKLHGEEALWYDPEPDEAQREHVLRAAAVCPVQAIVVQWSEAANRGSAEEPHE
jgi:ferredoxin